MAYHHKLLDFIPSIQGGDDGIHASRALTAPSASQGPSDVDGSEIFRHDLLLIPLPLRIQHKPHSALPASIPKHLAPLPTGRRRRTQRPIGAVLMGTDRACEGVDFAVESRAGGRARGLVGVEVDVQGGGFLV